MIKKGKIKMPDYFPFLPTSKEGIFFVDACIFSLSGRDNCYYNGFLKNLLTVDRIKEEASRLYFLSRKLSTMDNWVTIEEVIEEFNEGTDRFGKVQESINFAPLASALGELLNQRKVIYELLKQEHVNATPNLTDKLAERINYYILPKVNAYFEKGGGKITEKNTDCKLIATALAYAEDSPTCIFSHDRLLLKTFSHFAVKSRFPIRRTYIIDENLESRISTKEYYRKHCRRRH